MTTGIVELLNTRLLNNFCKTTEGFSATMAMSDLEFALRSEALLRPMHYEPIFGRKSMLAREALGRPRSEGRDFSIQKTVDQIVALGGEHFLDLLSVANALENSGDAPITVNISVASALSPQFWLEFIEHFPRIDPEKIIFEILEHPVENTNASIEHLKMLKNHGFRFALDDINIGREHDNRLGLFGPIIDYVKIDGPLVREKINKHPDDPDSLKNFINNIQNYRLNRGLPKAEIIAEFVDNFDEARRLFSMGVTAVQGRNLKENDYVAKILNGRPILSANDSGFGVLEEPRELAIA